MPVALVHSLMSISSPGTAALLASTALKLRVETRWPRVRVDVVSMPTWIVLSGGGARQGFFFVTAEPAHAHANHAEITSNHYHRKQIARGSRASPKLRSSNGFRAGTMLGLGALSSSRKLQSARLAGACRPAARGCL